MWPPHPSPSPPAGDLFDPSQGGEPKDSGWQRPVQALQDSVEPASESTHAIATVCPDLNDGQQRIAAAILAHCSLTTDDGAALVDQQRACLRSGALRRSEGIETLTALVRLLVERPLTTAGEVAEVHRAYHHLRQCHWWPSGPEDLPLAALLVAGAPDGDQQIARIEELHLALSEGDEVPGDPCALVALCGCVPDLIDAQVVARLGALRTELLLSGIAVQEEDIALLLALVAIPGDPEPVMREFLAERRKHSLTPNAPVSPLTIALAADVVVLRHLGGLARQVYIASLAIRAWLVHRHHQQRPSTRVIRRSS